PRVAQYGEVKRSDRVHLMQELHERVVTHCGGDKLAREVTRYRIVDSRTENGRCAQNRYDGPGRSQKEPARLLFCLDLIPEIGLAHGCAQRMLLGQEVRIRGVSTIKRRL